MVLSASSVMEPRASRVAKEMAFPMLITASRIPMRRRKRRRTTHHPISARTLTSSSSSATTSRAMASVPEIATMTTTARGTSNVSSARTMRMCPAVVMDRTAMTGLIIATIPTMRLSFRRLLLLFLPLSVQTSQRTSRRASRRINRRTSQASLPRQQSQPWHPAESPPLWLLLLHRLPKPSRRQIRPRPTQHWSLPRNRLKLLPPFLSLLLPEVIGGGQRIRWWWKPRPLPRHRSLSSSLKISA
mmetsp:Transcript_9538/g.26731  ORF Transcript_9538/g.26731 Transcript_9538/m.26731 type:complete len:244 (-) Transcript_9538:1800-2531(-)